MIGFLKKLFAPKADLAQLIKDGAIVIDVRTKGEFQSGHIKGSRNIPLDIVGKEAGALKKLNKPVVTVCRSGNRSGMAKSILSVAGIEVYNGGSWNSVNRLISQN